MKTGFIGIGKIAGAVVQGLCTSKVSHTEIYLSPRNEENASRLAAQFANVKKCDSNQEVLDRADIIFIALRPAVATDVLKSLSFRPDHMVVSFIPLLKYDLLCRAVTPASIVSRAIPLPSVVYHNCPIPVFKPNDHLIDLLHHIGQPLPVSDEQQLHALWTLTGLISPFFDQLHELSAWTMQHGVDATTANQYVADLFQSLAFMAQQTRPIDFNELASHAATPNGMNEQAAKEIRQKGAHVIYKTASDNLLKRFE